MDNQSNLVVLHISGQLPTPCHQLASAVCPSCAPNAPNLIQVNVHSLIEKGKTCRGPTTPFEQDIPIGAYYEGLHSVLLNGRHIGTFDAAKLGQPDAFLERSRGKVFIEGTHLRSVETENRQAILTIQGFLPTPCHVFQAEVSVPDSSNGIQVQAYSLVPLSQNCVDAIQDFTTDVPLGLLPTGTYQISLNDKWLGEISVP
ncbi:MAG: hypothetical protein HC806_07480 [Anaerolineae bacterium]|nr:hypothetical protein [Anaerolineae bacterium]